jgi:hypothetical protein
VARDRRRGGGIGPPRGPWVVIGLAVVAVVGVLLVIGLVGGSDNSGEGGGQAKSGSTTETQKTTPAKKQKPAPPKRVTLRIVPANEIYICVDNGPGTNVRFNGIISSPQTFRGRRVRVNLGKTDVQLTKNGKPVSLQPGPEPVGFDFTPRATKPIPLGQRPCA